MTIHVPGPRAVLSEAPQAAATRLRKLVRIATSVNVTNGVSVGVGLAFVSLVMHLIMGPAAAAAAVVGGIVATPPDQAWPRRGKFRQLLPAPLLGLPLFLAIQLLHAKPLELGLLLVPATFIAFTGMAWGKRGIPIAVAVMLSMVFSIATPTPPDLQEALTRSLHFGMGAALYVFYATLANLALNSRYRAAAVGDLLLTLATLMRTEALQFTALDPLRDVRDAPEPLLGKLLKSQAALADQLQAARDLVLESPRTAMRQRLAGVLLAILDIRDRLLATELDLDVLRGDPLHAGALDEMRVIFLDLARDTEAIGDSLLWHRPWHAITDRRPRLDVIGKHSDVSADGSPASPGPQMASTTHVLVRGLADRLGHVNDELLRLAALARGEVKPDLTEVRANWQLFVSPTAWSLRPFLMLWRWDAPPLRHAIRAALAIGVGYGLATASPWGAHAYWILITIVVVLRGSLAQTLERRNSRVAGTLMGCVAAVALLASQPSTFVLLAAVTISQGVAHGFAAQRYLITAIAATVLGLLQAHMLSADGGTAFALFERVADTLVGAGIAWGFSYVLPSWERSQIGALVQRTLVAQARHANLALAQGQLHAVETAPELQWRLARREAFDSLSALVLATQRSLVEPRAVRPPLSELEQLQAHSYQFLALLSAIKGMLVSRSNQLDHAEASQALVEASREIDAALDVGTGESAAKESAAKERAAQEPAAQEPAASDHSEGRQAPARPADVLRRAGGPLDPIKLPDPFERNIAPWLFRRLDLACEQALRLGEDGRAVRSALSRASAESAF